MNFNYLFYAFEQMVKLPEKGQTPIQKWLLNFCWHFFSLPVTSDLSQEVERRAQIFIHLSCI